MAACSVEGKTVVGRGIGHLPCNVGSFRTIVRRGRCCISGAVCLPLLRGRPDGVVFVHPHQFNGDVFLDVLRTCCSYDGGGGFRALFNSL